jgi:hypothetical protein
MKNENIIKTDKFTKFLLSIIAIALVAIVVKLYFSPEKAIAGPNVMDVNIKYVDGRSVSSGVLSVNLEQVDGRSVSGAIPVSLNALNNSGISSAAIPVELKTVGGTAPNNGVLLVKVVK